MSSIKMLDMTKVISLGRIIILCHGCFDALHIGHIRHLQAAKNLGGILIVTVTSDRYVNKGNNRPLFSAQERIEMLSALQCVDYVAINDAPDATKNIGIIRPDIYVKGPDYKGTNCEEFNAVKALGGKVVFTSTQKFSTTELINKLKKC